MQQREPEIEEVDSPVDAAREKMKKHKAFVAFIAVSAVMALVEPIVVGMGASIRIQIVILAVCTVLYIILLVLTFLFVDEEVGLVTRVTCLFDSEVMFETGCLIIGWAAILKDPGVAALRLCRALRVVWFSELVSSHSEKSKDPNYAPEEHYVSVARICNLGVKYMEAIQCELLTAKSKGGAVLLAMFFYITYVFGMVFWIEANGTVTPADTSPITGNNSLCETLRGCVFTLLRLSFYDGTGFDFLGYTFASGNVLLSILLLVYMVFGAMILLNGLIGIFGSAFADAGADADEEGGKETETGEAVDVSEEQRDSVAEAQRSVLLRLTDLRKGIDAVFSDGAARLSKIDDALRLKTGLPPSVRPRQKMSAPPQPMVRARSSLAELSGRGSSRSALGGRPAASTLAAASAPRRASYASALLEFRVCLFVLIPLNFRLCPQYITYISSRRRPRMIINRKLAISALKYRELKSSLESFCN